MLTTRGRRRAWFALALLSLVSAALTLFDSGAAHAQDDGGGVRGTLQFTPDGGGPRDRQPIEGGVVVVYEAELSPDGRSVVSRGAEVARAESAADGTFFVPLETPGDYVAEIDVSTLPDGVELVNAERSELAVRLSVGQARNLLFNLAESGAAETIRNRPTESEWTRAARLAVPGIQLGLIIGMCAIGLSLIFSTTRLVNFAHAEMITFGAVITWWLNVTLGIHLLIATPIAMLIGGAAGGLLDIGFWRPLRKRGTGLVAMMIISIGLSIFVRHVILYQFGGQPEFYDQYRPQRGQEPLIDIGPIEVLTKDFVIIVISAAVLVGVSLLLMFTKLGKAMRAVSDNPDLAASTGIDVDRTVTLVWFMAGVLVTLGAVFRGISENIQYLMGNQLLLLVFAAVTLGGLGTTFGVMVGGLIVGVFIEVSTVPTLWFDDPIIPSEMKNVGALLVMILLLMIRPQGIFGRRERIG